MSGEPSDLAGLLGDGTRTVVLTQAATPTEAKLIRRRIDASGGTERAAIDLGPPGRPDAPLPSSALPSSVLSPSVLPSSVSSSVLSSSVLSSSVLSSSGPGDEELRLVPVRIVWLPDEHARRAARLTGLMPGHDPYRPSERQQRRILARQPDRAQLLVGEPATVAELRRRWTEATAGGGDGDRAVGEDGGFGSYVARRATLALDRAEYRLRGPRYKTPSLVKEEILSSGRFRAGLRAVRREPDADPPTLAEAGEILDELAAGWSRRVIDIVPAIGRLIFSRGFDPQIDYDPAQVERLRAAMAQHPGILLWSHRSNLDNLVLTAAMQEQGLPPAHLFAGINMAFGPMGTLLRRAGVIFIRRSAGDDALYKYVLREYVGYVLEKRFNLSWSIEGTRSRTGKMLPPRLGLLSYAADAYLHGRVDDIALLPVSITFDQLNEIAEYAEYARGGAKKPEGFGWLYGFIRAQGARHYGKVYVRFGEPVSLASFLRPVAGAGGGTAGPDPAGLRLALQKTAFEVAWRINQGMPVTATALVTTVLLAMQGAALTFGQIRLGLADALEYLESRSVPRTASAQALSAPGPVRATLDALVHGGVVTYVEGGREPVWLIGPEHQLAATFYRNSLIHFLLDTALCEVAVLRARDAAAAGGADVAGVAGGDGPGGGDGPVGGDGPGGGEPVEAFWAEIGRLRDLLKFEFYFAERDEHRRQVAAEMARHDPGWEARLRAGPEAADALLAQMRPLTSHVMVRPFLDAYRIVADVLASDDLPTDGEQIKHRALGLGRQYVAQRRLRSSESVSVLLFQTGLQLAQNLGLLEPGPDLAKLRRRRAEFLAELRDLVRRLGQIEDLAIRRYIQDTVSPVPTD